MFRSADYSVSRSGPYRLWDWPRRGVEWTAMSDRRQMLARLACAAAAASLAAGFAQIQMSRPTAYAFSFTGLDGAPSGLPNTPASRS